MVRMYFADVGRFIDRRKAHFTHRSPNAMVAKLMPVVLHEPSQLMRSALRCFQEQSADDAHEFHVTGTFENRLIGQP